MVMNEDLSVNGDANPAPQHASFRYGRNRQSSFSRGAGPWFGSRQVRTLCVMLPPLVAAGISALQ